ncbi:concanavalin A-like lectin/glucanase domain-containing protein, partial [Coniochaeta sp. 2T2.1]
QIMLRSDTPFGPYEEWHRVLQNNGHPVPFGSSPYQGALVDTQDGDWWYIAFVNLFPGGRFPVLAPVTWSDGWPNVEFVNGTDWGSTYPYPLPKHSVTPIAGTDEFTTETLGPQYEWNHNPDNSKWSTGKGLTLSTATVTKDFFMARNTLSHRILGPKSSATIELDYSAMKDGDKAGLATFLYDAAWIGISMTSCGATLQMVDNIIMNGTDGWHTGTTGDVVASIKVSPKGSVWLRAKADITRDPAHSAFSYSTDGINFSGLGSVHHMDNEQLFFVGERYGVFNYATKSLSGKVIVKSFIMSATD